MTATFDSLATTTLSSAASTITFSSIPGTYTDLRLVLTGTTSSSIADLRIRFNSDSGTNYSRTLLRGNGTSTTSDRSTNATQIQPTAGNGYFSDVPSTLIADIFSYAGSTNKTVLCDYVSDRNGSGEIVRSIGMWRNTTAITSIQLDFGTVNFASGSTATLYGIKSE